MAALITPGTFFARVDERFAQLRRLGLVEVGGPRLIGGQVAGCALAVRRYQDSGGYGKFRSLARR